MAWDFVPDVTPKKRPRKARGRISPKGPYRAQSSTPSIRSKTSSAERRAFSHGSTPTAKRARKLARRDSRSTASAKTSTPSSSRPIDTLRRAEAKLARKDNATLRESARRLRHALASEAAFKAARKTPEGSPIKANIPKADLKAVAPRAYDKAKATAEAGGHGSSKGLSEPEDLTTAITILAPGGGAVGALGKRAAEIGGKALAKDVLEAGAGKLESTAAKAELKGIKAGNAVKAGGRLAGNLVRRVAGRETKKATESAARIAAEKAIARGESRMAATSLPGLKLAKVAGGQAFPVVRGHEQALIDNPKKTLKTTARALPGLVTAPVGMAADAAITGGRAASTAASDVGIPGAAHYTGKEILAPVKHIPAEQLAFAKQVAKVVTSSDPKAVQKEVEDNLGLMLPIMLGLGSKAVSDKLSHGKITEAVRKIAENTRERHGKAHGYTDGKAPHVLERTRQRKAAAIAVAKGRSRLHIELHDRQQPILEHARGATDSAIVRKGVLRGKHGKKLDLEIHDADVVSFLQRHPMKMNDPVAMLHEVRRIGQRLKEPPKGMEPDPTKLTTRDVIAHIEKKPDVLANPSVIAAVRSYRDQGKYARENHELAPEHSDRARFLSAATTRDIPFPEEMFPKSVRDVVRATPERGKLAKDVLRKEARRDRSRGRALRKKAATLERKGAIMRRELEIREKGNKTRLGTKENPWSVLRSVGADLPVRHEKLRVAIDKIDRNAADAKEAAVQAEEMAVRKHKASREVDTSLTPEFAGIVAKRLKDEGITELPEYQHAGIGHDRNGPVYGSTGTKLTQLPGASKRRAGTAEEHGLVEEGLRPMIRESIARPIARRESYKAARQVMNENEFNPGGKKEWTAREADELFSGPDPVLSPDQWTKVPRQFYKRIYDVLEGKGPRKGISAQDFQMVGELEAIRSGKAVAGTHYKIVRKPAMDELTSQLANTLVSPKIAKVNRATSFLILGTSPAWAAMQVVAEYGQGAAAQTRLLDPTFVRKAIKAYNDMAPDKRQAFDAWVGVTSRTIGKAEDLKLDLKSGDMDSAAKAYTTLEGTQYGRFIRGIPTSIARVDQWKGGKIRALVALAKIDKDLNARTNTFIRGVGGLNREMGKALQDMKGKSLKEQAEWVSSHPKWEHRYQSYLDDVMGNWSALTKNERVAAQAMIFYPFVRMSLRWTFYAFPKRHPIKAAMLYWLGQQNAQEVHKLLHGDPSYFTQYAMVPINPSEGAKGGFLDLSRIAPGSNALVEALGGGSEGPKGAAIAKLAQPAIAALGTAIYGVSPLSGKQEAGSGWNALGQLLSLSPLTRVAGEATMPSNRKKSSGAGQLPVIGSFSTERQHALDKLSAKLRETGSASRYVRQLALPPLAKNVGKEADSALLGRVLKAFGENSSTARDDVTTQYANKLQDLVEEGKHSAIPALKKEREERLGAMETEYAEANNQLDKLFEKYGIKHEKEDALFLKFYDEGKYPGSSSSSDNPWGGSSGGEESNPWGGGGSSSSTSRSASGNPWGNG